MSSSSSSVCAQLGQEISTWTIMLHQAISEHLGLGAGDHKFLMFLSQPKPLTAGDLAEQTGLTTGAITGVIDRLERAGFVHREPDPNDRRRVLVRPIPEKCALVRNLFEPLIAGIEDLDRRYPSAQLEIIQGYLRQMRDLLKAETHSLRRNLPN